MNTKVLGNTGEHIACIFLRNKKFKIVSRNYRKLWGEIDIVAKKTGVVHFFEVKTVVSYSVAHRPEDNVHGLKVKRIRRMIETYLEEEGIGLDAEFYFHVLCVYFDLKTRRARVKWIENVIL